MISQFSFLAVIVVRSEQIKANPTEMKLFQSVRNFHKVTGLKPSPTDPNARVLNIHNSLFFLSMIPMLVSTLGVFMFQELTYIDYAITFYIFITCVASMGTFLISFLKIKDLYLFFERIEIYINASRPMKCWLSQWTIRDKTEFICFQNRLIRL